MFPTFASIESSSNDYYRLIMTFVENGIMIDKGINDTRNKDLTFPFTCIGMTFQQLDEYTRQIIKDTTFNATIFTDFEHINHNCWNLAISPCNYPNNLVLALNSDEYCTTRIISDYSIDELIKQCLLWMQIHTQRQLNTTKQVNLFDDGYKPSKMELQ